METNTAPIPTVSSIEAGLTLLASSLVLATRTDGTEYRMLREDCPIHDDLQDRQLVLWALVGVLSVLLLLRA